MTVLTLTPTIQKKQKSKLMSEYFELSTYKRKIGGVMMYQFYRKDIRYFASVIYIFPALAMFGSMLEHELY